MTHFENYPVPEVEVLEGLILSSILCASGDAQTEDLTEEDLF